MKAPYGWLTEYVDVRLSPERLAQQLTLAGLEVTGIATIDGEPVLEFEITPNRPDALSLIGIAREIAAITGRKLRVPAVVMRSATAPRTTAKSATLKIRIADIKSCPRYLGRLMAGVRVSASPAWLAQRLHAAGLCPVNNIVDITNYVLWETGQPLHAFDADRLSGGQIVVRRATPGEKIVTIDGKERALDGETLVIADSAASVAVAGVMGGRATEVTERTTRVLLESAVFDPLVVRRSARRLGVSSDSSYRFERGVDPAGLEWASARAAQLIAQLAQGAEVAAQDVGRKPVAPRAVSVRPERLQQWLGAKVETPAIRQSLERLGCRITTYLTKPWSVQPPSFRRDLVREVDFLEEIARLHGYDKLPSTLPAVQLAASTSDATPRRISDEICTMITALGFDEAITYRLLSRALIDRCGLTPVPPTVRVSNPLTQEQEWLRPSLWPGLLQAAALNLHRGASGVRLFELGAVYHRQGSAAVTAVRLGLIATGQWHHTWTQGKTTAGWPHVQGALETVLARLGVQPVTMQPSAGPWGPAAAWGALTVDGDMLGGCGEVPRDVAEAFDLPERAWAGEVWLACVLPRVQLARRFQSPPRYPAIRRDIAMVIKPRVTHEAIHRLIHEAGQPLAARVELFDKYTGKQVPTDHVGLAYSVEYRHPERTLTDEEVDALHGRVCETLVAQLGVQIRR